jgi:hypothetical protein
MRVLAVLFGIILLLPGLCSLGFMAILLPAGASGGNASVYGMFGLLWIVCFAISFGGILMIRAGIRGPRTPQQQPPLAPRD